MSPSQMKNQTSKSRNSLPRIYHTWRKICPFHQIKPLSLLDQTKGNYLQGNQSWTQILKSTFPKNIICKRIVFLYLLLNHIPLLLVLIPFLIFQLLTRSKIWFCRVILAHRLIIKEHLNCLQLLSHHKKPFPPYLALTNTWSFQIWIFLAPQFLRLSPCRLLFLLLAQFLPHYLVFALSQLLLPLILPQLLKWMKTIVLQSVPKIEKNTLKTQKDILKIFTTLQTIIDR